MRYVACGSPGELIWHADSARRDVPTQWHATYPLGIPGQVGTMTASGGAPRLTAALAAHLLPSAQARRIRAGPLRYRSRSDRTQHSNRRNAPGRRHRRALDQGRRCQVSMSVPPEHETPPAGGGVMVPSRIGTGTVTYGWPVRYATTRRVSFEGAERGKPARGRLAGRSDFGR